MDDGTTKANSWQAVCEAMVTHVLSALQVIYDDFNVSLEQWLNGLVSHPIAEDWHDEVAAFVDETERKGLRILPDSIRVIEALIESRIAGTGQFARFGLAPRGLARTRPIAPSESTLAAEADSVPVELEADTAPADYPGAPVSHRGPSVGAQQLFDEKIASAKSHFAVLDQLLKAAGEKVDAVKPGEEVDIEYEAEMVQKHLFLYNEDLLVAGDVWLRFNLSSDGIARMTELINPMSMGLPMFASPAQAERARQQRIAISRRLNQQNATMDAWVTGIQATEMAATAVGIVAGAGLLVVAAKKGGTWAVVKTVAAGATAIAIDQGADAGLRAAGANEQTVNGVRLAAAIITLILLHKVAKKVSPGELPPESQTGGYGMPPAGEPAAPAPRKPGGTPPGKPEGTPPRTPGVPPARPSGPPPSKPPFPPPRSNPAYKWHGHRTAAEAEEALARTIHELPDEVVVRWGDPIGSHGADVVSVNIKTGEVTLWDSKFRSGSVRIQPSKTFQLTRSRSGAIGKAQEAIEANTTRPAEIRAAALKNLDKGRVTTHTVGAGNARNSTLK